MKIILNNYMLKLLIISSFVFLFGFNQCFGGEVDKKLHQECLYPTIYVGRADRRAYGSGVIIRSEKVSDGLYKNAFITCGHLVEEDTLDYEVKFYLYEDWSQLKGTKSYAAIFYGVNHVSDIAVGLFYSDMEMPVAHMNFNPKIYIGNEVFRIGCGLGDEPRLDYGRITSYRKTFSKSVFRTSVQTVPGDSGSPVFHENKVIGIMVSVRVYHDNLVFFMSYAVPLDKFKQWNKNDGIAFVWDNTKAMPYAPFLYLNFKNDYEVSKN